LAGLKIYTPAGQEATDWLEALGYPAAAWPGSNRSP